MAAAYANFEFRVEVSSPVAADSPFDSDTLWGRIVCALAGGSEAEQRLAGRWLDELAAVDPVAAPDWQPPLLVSEGFQCDQKEEPWLPLPLAIRLALEQAAGREQDGSRKQVKRLETVPRSKFFEICERGAADLKELLAFAERRPGVEPALQPHLVMNRASSVGIDGLLYMTSLHLHRQGPHQQRPAPRAESSPPERARPSQIVFFLRVRDVADREVLDGALRQICDEGWGNGKSRGLGRIRFPNGSLEPWSPPEFEGAPDGFVSLSHFCPARRDPTDGFWKLQAKHPVPAQFLADRRIALGERQNWRVKSFLRLRAGSCLRKPSTEVLRDYYGRMLTGLLNPAEDSDGKPLPTLFHYALAFPVPMRWPPSAGEHAAALRDSSVGAAEPGGAR